MQKKRKQQPTNDIQMMIVEPRAYQPCINIVIRNGASIGDDKGKKRVEEK